MKKGFLVVAALVLSVGLYAQDGTMMKSDKPAADGSMMKGDKKDASLYDLKGLGKQVIAFTTEKDAALLAKDQTVVYFFAATWCPTCQAFYKDLKSNASSLPLGLTLVFVNYDKSADLKKKYGVTSQHTFVVIGQGGEKRKVWNGSMTVADFLTNSKSM